VKATEVAESLEGGLLRHVLGIFVVPGHPKRETIKVVAVLVDQSSERVPIAETGGRDERCFITKVRDHGG